MEGIRGSDIPDNYWDEIEGALMEAESVNDIPVIIAMIGSSHSENPDDKRAAFMMVV